MTVICPDCRGRGYLVIRAGCAVVRCSACCGRGSREVPRSRDLVNEWAKPRVRSEVPREN